MSTFLREEARNFAIWVEFAAKMCYNISVMLMLSDSIRIKKRGGELPE